jgi:ferrochelatase
MHYPGQSDYAHDTQPRAGVLLTNLGTPDAPDTGAVRRYLAAFLSDPRVVERPRWFWLPILYGIILQVRPPRSAKAYRKIWTGDGSPLLVISKRIADAVESSLKQQLGNEVPVALGMRYGNPSIASALSGLRARGATRITVLPLYPQYCGSTTGSTFDAVSDALRKQRWVPALHFISSYHDDPGYIAALAESVRAHRRRHGAGDRLLLSFHGIPKRYFDAGDPYHCHCRKSARLLAESLGLDDGDWALSFQSRVGPDQWLEPYTDRIIDQWAAQGVKTLDVMAPGFAADCLETLEEIALRYAEQFAARGGTLRYIPALNDGGAHIGALTALLLREAGGGLRQTGGDSAGTLERARALGAKQ